MGEKIDLETITAGDYLRYMTAPQGVPIDRFESDRASAASLLLPPGCYTERAAQVLMHRPSLIPLVLEAANIVKSLGGFPYYTGWSGVFLPPLRHSADMPVPAVKRGWKPEHSWHETPEVIPSMVLLLGLHGEMSYHSCPTATAASWRGLARAAGLHRKSPPKFTAEQALRAAGICSAVCDFERCTAPDILAIAGAHRLIPALRRHDGEEHGDLLALMDAAAHKPRSKRLQAVKITLDSVLRWELVLRRGVPELTELQRHHLVGSFSYRDRMRSFGHIRGNENPDPDEVVEALRVALPLIEHFTVDGQPIDGILKEMFPQLWMRSLITPRRRWKPAA